eukprot:scaffold385128_cov45-Prasinocladus_malaysianus.AAC.1
MSGSPDGIGPYSSSITVESTPEDIFGQSAVQPTNVVSFDGYIGEDPAVLNTLDVCYDDSLPYRELFVANYFLRNVSSYNPSKPEYYMDYVLPRVLPWAASFLG